jgi:hypothetical protein
MAEPEKDGPEETIMKKLTLRRDVIRQLTSTDTKRAAAGVVLYPVTQFTLGGACERTQLCTF